MPITVNSTPEKSISGYDSIYSATTQHRYELKRYDYDLIQSNTVENKFALDAAAGDVTGLFTPGTKFYYEDGTSNDGYYTVQTSSIPASNTEIFPVETIDNQVFGGTIYLPTLYESYLLQIIIPELNDLDLYFAVNPSGRIIFDLGPLLAGAIDQQLLYNATYTELWSGSSNSPVSLGSILAVKANKQLLSTYGSNLYDHVMRSANPGKLLTNQTEPKYWHGWKRSASVINDTSINIDTYEQQLDANKAPTGTTTINNHLVSADSVDNFTLLTPTLDAGAKYINLYFFESPDIVTEQKHYLIEPECRQPIMIEWVNQLGGYDQWLFIFEQAVTDDTEQGLIFERSFTDDIQTVTQTKQRAPGETRQLMTLKAGHLSQNDIQHLHEIKQSDIVRAFLTKDGTEYIDVIVNTGYQTSFTTGKGGYEYALNIEFPSGFDFFKGKKY